MELWNFSTSAYVESDRLEGWRRALESTQLSMRALRQEERFFGIAAAIAPPQGTEYVYLSSRAQDVVLPRCSAQQALLMLVIEGKGKVLQKSEEPQSFLSGDLIFGTPRHESALSFDDDFRLLLLRLPKKLLAPRLLSPIPGTLHMISGDTGLATIFGDLLGSMSSKLGQLSIEQFTALEASIVEFLACNLLSDGDATLRGGMAGRRAGLLNRIAQTIEKRLGEPELNLADIAEESGMSVRSLQKLFMAFEKTFSTYVRSRRLERSREDLASPQCSQLSISEICYRWGFTDPAYFSRTFRDEFSVSPREFRRNPNLYQADERGRTYQRGRPANAADQGEDDAPAPASRPIVNPRKGDGPTENYLPARSDTIHWGYFSKYLAPVLQVRSGDFVTIECLTHHAYDDYERMIAGDPGAEDVFHWSADVKNVNRRGAGPIDASTFGRGAGEGFGVHICTGPVAVEDARPGDVLEVRILSMEPRTSHHPDFEGRAFGSNAAAFWGFHFKHMLTEPREREVITIYEVDCESHGHKAKAVYNYRWTPQTDPFGVVHDKIDYPGVPVDHTSIVKNFECLRDIEIPVRPHFGVLGLAPDHSGLVDSVPPSSFGGNIDNWRVGAGSSVYLPVAVAGALLSVGDPHASQGDGEACGTAIECSMTGRFQLVLHKRTQLAGTPYADLNYPLIETADEWVISGFSHPDYLEELGQNAQSDIYQKSSIDFAMRDAFRKVRRFLMSSFSLSEDEAVSLISVGVDFGVTQVADGNWGVHAVVRKEMFRNRSTPSLQAPDSSGSAP